MSASNHTPTAHGPSAFRIPFGGSAADTPSKETVGSKAHNLMVMARHGLPVPPAFVFGTDLCRSFLDRGDAALAGLEDRLAQQLEWLSTATGRRFGDARKPLLVSVRSGAAVSMPGMMETVLNVGLTEAAVRGLVRLTGNPRLAWDCRRRLVQQFAEVAHGADPRLFEEIVAQELRAQCLGDPAQLGSESLAEVARRSAAQFEAAIGKPFPDDPLKQLVATIRAVLESWSSDRATSYRRLNGIDDRAGTAVIVQAMAFGNSGASSGSGVGFTRSPADGANALYIDYLPNAQGEDVVAGRRSALDAAELERRAPAAFAQLRSYKPVLERAFGDMQDFEFTVEDGRLYVLQCRTGKRTPLAALRIACDLVSEELIEPATALERLATYDLSAIATERFADADLAPIAHGAPASAGVLAGLAVFDPSRICELKKREKPLVLLREFAETADFDALAQVDGLVTAHGARTSHAAVVARQLGKVCVVGCAALRIDASGRGGCLGERTVEEGESLSIDGARGAIYAGELPVIRVQPDELIERVHGWRSEHGAVRQ